LTPVLTIGASKVTNTMLAGSIAQSKITNLTSDLSGKQALNSYLTAIAGLSPNSNDVLQFKVGSWANRSPGQFKVDLGLNSVDNTSDATKNSATATLTNKTINGGNNILSNISLSSLNITGTPDGSKFLRDDGKWETVSS